MKHEFTLPRNRGVFFKKRPPGSMLCMAKPRAAYADAQCTVIAYGSEITDATVNAGDAPALAIVTEPSVPIVVTISIATFSCFNA